MLVQCTCIKIKNKGLFKLYVTINMSINRSLYNNNFNTGIVNMFLFYYLHSNLLKKKND